MNESALATLDFGVVKANCNFAVCSHPMYADNLILLGSSALKDLSIVADFENDVIFIKNTYPVKLLTVRTNYTYCLYLSTILTNCAYLM